MLLGQGMPATMEERLDELLAMSREVGRLACELARWEHEAEYGVQSSRDKNRRRLRETRKAHETAVERVARVRDRFLVELPIGESAP